MLTHWGDAVNWFKNGDFCLGHSLHTCQELTTTSEVPLDCEWGWFETCNIDVILCWTDDLAFQKPKLENIKPFLVAVPSLKFVSNSKSNTPEKHAVSTARICTVLFFILITHEMMNAIMWCTSATKPELQIFNWILLLIGYSLRFKVIYRIEHQFSTRGVVLFLDYLKSNMTQYYFSPN